MNSINFKSTSLKDTQVLSRCTAKAIVEGTVILLDGQLGAGKTVLTKGIAKQLGVLKNITSPTFNIVKEYDGTMKIFHVDLYRISAADFLDLGYLDEIGKKGVGVIEWGNKMRPFFDDYLYVEIEIIDETSRLFKITGIGTKSLGVLEELKKCLS